MLLLDAGDFVAREGRQAEKNSIQLKIAAEFMLEGMDWMGYAASGIGEGDLVFGDAFLRRLGAAIEMPLLSASLSVEGLPVFPEYTVATVGGVRAGIVGILSEAFADYLLDHSDPGRPVAVTPLGTAARRGLELLGGGADLKILLAHAELPAVRAILETTPGYDIVISGHDTNHFVVTKPERINGACLVQTGWDGMQVGRLDLRIDREGTIVEVEGSAKNLDRSVPDHPQMVALHEEYLARVAEAIEEILEAYPIGPPPSGGHFVGANECRRCHESQWTSWRATEHAAAWATLRDRHRDYDPECFSCHTTGFQFEGGFRLITETPLMGDVQCEMCHGAGADHCASPSIPYARPGEATCAQCHVVLHSPEFDYETYLPKVRHAAGASQ